MKTYEIIIKRFDLFLVGKCVHDEVIRRLMISHQLGIANKCNINSLDIRDFQIHKF